MRTVKNRNLIFSNRMWECQFSYKEPWLLKQKLPGKPGPKLWQLKENRKLHFISRKQLLYWRNPPQLSSWDIYRWIFCIINTIWLTQILTLQTLNAISTEQSSTIVFPFPIDTLCISMGQEKEKEKEKEKLKKISDETLKRDKKSDW